MKKKSTIFLIATLFAMDLANDVFAQSRKSPYQIVIEGDGFSTFDGKNYKSITIFLNNNTDETLYYRGTDCYNLLFQLKRNPYFHLATDMCKNSSFTKMVLPPRRSQKMEIFLIIDKEPDRDVSLSIDMKLYNWNVSNSIPQRKNAAYSKLSDVIVLHYNVNHQPYWSKEESIILDEKRKSILPDKDIYLLTDVDRKLYRLTVNEKHIASTRDTVIFNYKNRKTEKVKIFSVPVSLRNNSNDTLKFYSMSCSWDILWATDRQGVNLPTWPCEKNSSEIVTVLPHHEYNRKLDVTYYSTVKRGSKFRLSMSLLKIPNNAKWAWDFVPDRYVRFNKIWSNANN